MTNNDPKNKTGAAPKNKSRRLYIYGRFTIISLGMLAIVVACIIFLINTAVIHQDEWTAKGDMTLADSIVINPLRGDILADDGSIMATNLNYYIARIDFRASRINELKYIESLDSLADTLAVYYPQRTRQEWRDYLYKPMTQPKKDRSRNYTILKYISWAEFERLRNFPYFRRSRNPNRTGLTYERVLRRTYPYGDMARLSIGRVGQTTTDPQIRGRSGLEQALDSILYGVPGIAKKVLFTRGESFWTTRKPVDGTTITTTIDITLQDLLEHELGNMLVECNAEWGSAMIMEVSTGDIKAICNLDRDTITPGGGYIEAMNHIVMAYEPGSVIKIVSMLTALEDGYVNLNQTFPIGRTYSYAGGKPIRDTHSPAYLPVSRFIEYSSNIGMTKLIAPRYAGDLNGFRERLRKIGFFDRLNTGMAGERRPYYPTLDPKAGGHVSLSRMIFGYSTMVPPLYTCAFYNAIANNGKFVRPRLVKELHLPDGRDSVIPVSYVRDSICSAANAAILRQMMHDVVWGEGGTAKVLRNKTVEIAGKTGTAGIALERPTGPDGKPLLNVPFKGGYREGRHNRVTFCGFFPYENPMYTCIVVISDPQGAKMGASYTSGTVLLNLALKMYSRGMLGNSSNINDIAAAASMPTLYGHHDAARAGMLHEALGLSRAGMISTPVGNTPAGTIPNVMGLGIREALVVLERAGYIVNFSGTGYVTSCLPEPGTPAEAGTRVTVTLSQQ